jgi:hypothetical protein
MCDMVENAEHWRVAVWEAQELQHAIMGYLPGYATPRIVCDVPHVGKRWGHQIEDYDRELGISYWTKNHRTGIELEDPEALNRRYPYYDPISTLGETGQKWRSGLTGQAGLGPLRKPLSKRAPIGLFCLFKPIPAATALGNGSAQLPERVAQVVDPRLRVLPRPEVTTLLVDVHVAHVAVEVPGSFLERGDALLGVVDRRGRAPGSGRARAATGGGGRSCTRGSTSRWPG